MRIRGVTLLESRNGTSKEAAFTYRMRGSKLARGLQRTRMHAAPDPNPEIIKFLGMAELWERFWSKIWESEFEVK